MKENNETPFNLRFPKKQLKKKLTQEAKEQGRSLNKHIIFILEKHGEGISPKMSAETA